MRDARCGRRVGLVGGRWGWVSPLDHGSNVRRNRRPVKGTCARSGVLGDASDSGRFPRRLRVSSRKSRGSGCHDVDHDRSDVGAGALGRSRTQPRSAGRRGRSRGRSRPGRRLSARRSTGDASEARQLPVVDHVAVVVAASTSRRHAPKCPRTRGRPVVAGTVVGDLVCIEHADERGCRRVVEAADHEPAIAPGRRDRPTMICAPAPVSDRRPNAASHVPDAVYRLA